MRLNEHTLARLCLLAYKDPADLKDSLFAEFNSYQGLQRGGTECIIAEDNGTAVVAIRGTQTTWLDWLRDFQFLFPKPIHRGFRRSADQLTNAGLWESLEAMAPHTVWFIGHSLGGGCAATLAWDGICRELKAKINLFTVGQPRTGLKDWSRTLDAALHSMGGRIDRFVHPLDIVPRVPPAAVLCLPDYRHHGPTRMIVDDKTIVEDANIQENLMAMVWQLVCSPRKVRRAHSCQTYVDSLQAYTEHCRRNGLNTIVDHETVTRDV